MIEFRALGAVDLRRRDGPELLSVLSQPKRTALLAYLVLARPRGFHRRDQLVALFWPEADAEHGRNSLRQSVYFLRRSLGEEVLAARGEEELSAGSGQVWCDAQAFEEALDRGEAEAALALYGGELLPGFFVDGAPEFERWLESERSHLRGRALRAACDLAQARERAGDLVGAVQLGERALALAPEDETLLRAQMLRLAQAGDRASALATYDGFARRLLEEYELEPDPESRALAEEIRSRPTAPLASARATAVPLPPSAVPPPVPTAAPPAPPAGEASPALPPTAVLPGEGAPPSVAQVPPPSPGLRRSARWRRGLLPIGALLVLGAAAVGGWWARYGRHPTASPRRIVVAAFENQTGDAALAPLSSMAADWITQGLTETGIVEVVDAPTALTVAREAGIGTAVIGAGAARLLSRETGAGLVVTGRYYQQADSIAFLAQVVDARTGRVVRAVSPVTAPAALPVRGAERLRQRLMAELAVLLDERLARFQALEREPPSYGAYREYMDGLARFLVTDSTAVSHFDRAFALDSTFYRAALWAAQSMWVADPGSTLERWDSALARAERLRGFLTPAEQYQLDYVRAMRAGDFRAACAAARLRLEAFPGSDGALRELALCAFRLYRLREAGDLLARAEWNRGLLRLNYSEYISLVGWTQHLRGDFAGELRSAAEWARRAPASPEAQFQRLEALAAIGRVDEVRALAARLADRMLSSGESPAWPFVDAAHELAAHGRPSDALTLAQIGLTRCEAAAPTPDRLPPMVGAGQAPVAVQGWRLDCADLLGLLGRWREADALIPRIEPSGALRLSYLTSAGIAAARLGDPARALAFSDSLARMPARTRGEKWQAQFIEFDRALIAAALGDREDALLRLRLWRTTGSSRPMWLHSAPALIPFLSDPRFRELLKSED